MENLRALLDWIERNLTSGVSVFFLMVMVVVIFAQVFSRCAGFRKPWIPLPEIHGEVRLGFPVRLKRSGSISPIGLLA
jgi:hypothetical protein